MKLLKAFILTILSFSLALVATAQDSNFTEGELVELGTNIDDVRGNYYLTAQTRDVEGDPYFNTDLLRGKVEINEKAQTGDLFLRFNMADNILEFARGEELYLMDSNKIQGFTLFGQPENVEFRNGFTSDQYDIESSTFLRIIYDGESKMVAHHTASLKENLASYGSATIKDKYVDNTNYYIIDDSGEFKEVKLKKRDVLKKLNKDVRGKIETYANEQGLRFNEEKDLKKILAKYDELKTQS